MTSKLDEKLKKKINKNYVQIINTQDPKMMLTYLKQTGILTVGGYEPYYEELNNMLTHGKTKTDINIRLLDILYTRDRWWISYLKALHQCELQTIIDILEGAMSQREVRQLHQEIGEDCLARTNRRPLRSERAADMRVRQTSDSDSDMSLLTDSGQYHSLPEPRSRRKTSREAGKKVTRQNSSRRFRSDCFAAPDDVPQNDLSWTGMDESNGYVPNGYLEHPGEQDNPSSLHLQQHHQPFSSRHGASQTQTGSSHNDCFDRGFTQSCPRVGTTVLARSSSAPVGPHLSKDFIPRQSNNPSNASQVSHQRGQGQVANGQFSPTESLVRSPSAPTGDRTSEGGSRTSGPLGAQAFGPQADRSTSYNDCSSLAPLARQEQIHVNLNTPLRQVPMKLLKLLDRLDYNQKWRDFGSVLTDKFLTEDHSKILACSDELKTKQVLEFFMGAEGDRATLGRLITALQKMQRQDLLDDMKEMTGLTFQDEEDVINENTRKNSWTGANSDKVDFDIPTPDIWPPSVSSAARTDAIDQVEQSSISSSTLPGADPNKSRDEAKQTCIRTTEDDVSHPQGSITGAISDSYVSHQIILSQLEQQKKLDEALKRESLRNQNRPIENPNEEHLTEQEHGNPPSLESESSDENNVHQNSSNNAEGGAAKMESAENQDTKTKPELESKVINTNSSDSRNRDTIASTNPQPTPITTSADGSHSPSHSSINSTGNEGEVCQHGQAVIHYPPQLSIHTNDHGYPTDNVSSSHKSAESVPLGQLPNFDQIIPVSLQSSGTSNSSQSIPGHNGAASNNPSQFLGPNSGVSAGTHAVVGDKTSSNNYEARHDTRPKTVADSNDQSIAFTDNANTASKFIAGQHRSSVEGTTPPEHTGATGNVGPDLLETSNDSVYYVGTLGSSILDDTQSPTYQENSQYIGERHILTMSEASMLPSFIADHHNKILQQSMKPNTNGGSVVEEHSGADGSRSINGTDNENKIPKQSMKPEIYYERVQNTYVEDEFLSLGESVDEEQDVEEEGEPNEVEGESQGQGHPGADGSRSINGGFQVLHGTATTDSRSIAPAADGTGVSASSTSGCTSCSADGNTSTGNAANANRGTLFSNVIVSGLNLLKIFNIATDVNAF